MSIENQEIYDPKGPQVSFGTLKEAETLSREFHARFPQAEVNTIIAAARRDSFGAQWRVVFESNVKNNKEIMDWLKEKGL